MTDELFDYFGKGSKKFEPLDDDLDLPEVSPKRRDDAVEEAELEPVKASAQPLDDTSDSVESEPVASDDDDSAFAGFGAGLFDDSTDELPPRKQVAKAKPAAKPVAKVKPAATEPNKPEVKAKPVDPKPVVEEVAAVEQAEETEDSEGGTWDFLAGMLGIGGKKAKAETTDETTKARGKVTTGDDNPPAAAAKKSRPEADVKSIFQEPKPAPEAAVDALFNAADDDLDLAGWGDEEDDVEPPVAVKPAKAERAPRSGRGKKREPAKEDRKNRGRSATAKAPVVDDSIDEDAGDIDDENFIEFEVEELSRSAREIKDAPSSDRPRRRRRPARKSVDDDSVSDNDAVSDDDAVSDVDSVSDDDAPRSKSRRNRDDAPSESRSGGRGRSRGRGRGRNQSDAPKSRSSETVAKSDSDSASDDWRDDKPAVDSEQRNERSRGSRGRGRGRKRPERPARDSKPFEEDSLDDELEISSFVDDDGDDTETEEAPKKSRRSRRPRSRSRGRNRSDNDRDDADQDTDLDASGSRF